MVLGFVLISTAPQKEREVYNEVTKIKEVIEAHPLFGEFDIIVKVEAADYNRLGEVIVDKIRGVKGVIDTRTLTSIKT
jgi:DNA-binding Lrp family transcriptional regulator